MAHHKGPPAQGLGPQSSHWSVVRMDVDIAPRKEFQILQHSSRVSLSIQSKLTLSRSQRELVQDQLAPPVKWTIGLSL